MILPIASFLVLEKPKSCTCGGAQCVWSKLVNEPPSYIGSNVKRLKNKYIYA